MNQYLLKALEELEDLEAEDVPEVDEIMEAEDDSEWSGTTEDGGHWKLIKHHKESYTTSTEKD